MSQTSRSLVEELAPIADETHLLQLRIQQALESNTITMQEAVTMQARRRGNSWVNAAYTVGMDPVSDDTPGSQSGTFELTLDSTYHQSPDITLRTGPVGEEQFQRALEDAAEWYPTEGPERVNPGIREQMGDAHMTPYENLTEEDIRTTLTDIVNPVPRRRIRRGGSAAKRKKQENKLEYFKHRIRIHMTKIKAEQQLIYDIKSIPEFASLEEILKFYEESRVVLWDSDNNGEEPKFLSLSEDIQIKVVDLKGQKSYEELADFLARNILDNVK